MGLANGAVIVIAIVGAATVVLVGYAFFRGTVTLNIFSRVNEEKVFNERNVEQDRYMAGVREKQRHAAMMDARFAHQYPHRGTHMSHSTSKLGYSDGPWRNSNLTPPSASSTPPMGAQDSKQPRTQAYEV